MLNTESVVFGHIYHIYPVMFEQALLTSSPMANVAKNPIDFSSTPLDACYSSFYAVVFDNVFTPEECTALLARASASAPWTPAGLNANSPTQTVHTDFRNSDRIILIDDEMSQWIYDRLRPHVEELWEIVPASKWGVITGKEGRKQGPVWKLAGSVL